LSSGKKNPSTLMKKSNFGIKINTKTSQSKTSMTENTVPDNQETISQSGKTPDETSTSTTNATVTSVKSNVASNSLSLLGAYSGSSSDNNDSD